MELDGVFLDMYGTLTAGDRQAVEATCEHLVRDFRLAISAHELSITWGERFFHALDFCNGDAFLTLFDVERRTLRETMAALGVTMDPTPYAEMLRRYWSDPPLQPEAIAFLQTCSLPVCLVSNADRVDIDAVIERHALKLERVVTSEDARSYKPDRAIFDQALAQTGWRRERVIHVGDSLHSDVGGAMVAGLRSGWVNRAHRIHDIGTHTPDHEFGDLLEFLRWLDQGA
ncbi:MAG: haloacid dehalogenase [Phycisphaerae bacterium]|nr:MAG: HAD family hydrolase [Planctomycetia bacterium]GJQ27570.1 MAG: haloacid dehalogenase [Phycisphaerae bacterium]